MAQGKTSMSKVADWIGVSAPLLDVEITEVSNIDGAGASSVVFAMDKETLTKALESKAGAILANRNLEAAELPLDPRVLWVGDARYAFAVVGWRLKGRGFEAGVHPSAVVGASVTDRGGKQGRAGGGARGRRGGGGRLQPDGSRGRACWDCARRPRRGAGRGGTGIDGIRVCAKQGDGGVSDLSATGAAGD